MKRLPLACVLLFVSSAFAATTIVQSAVITTNSSTVCTITFTKSMVRWNTAIFWVAANGPNAGAAATAVPSSGGNPFTLIHNDVITLGGVPSNVYSWYSVIQVPGQFSLTATMTGGAGAVCGAMELQGIGATPTPHFFSFQSFVVPTTSWSTGAGSPAAGDFVFSYGGDTIGESVIAGTGTGWTFDQTWRQFGEMSFQQYIVSAPGGPITPTATLTTASPGFMAFISITPGGAVPQRPTGKSSIF